MKVIVFFVMSASLAVLGLHSWTIFATALSVSYVFDLEHAETGEARIALTAKGGALEGLNLMPLLDTRKMNVRDLEAQDGMGRSIPIVEQQAPQDFVEAGEKQFTRYILHPREPCEIAVIRYTVRPALYRPPNGDRVLRSCGWIDEMGCALGLSNLLLLPEGQFSSVGLRRKLPPEWSVLVDLPDVIDIRKELELWGAALIAGSDPASPRSAGHHVSIEGLEELCDEADATVSTIMEELTKLLGPPRQMVRIIALPEREGAEIAVPGANAFAAVSFDSWSVECLRNLIRRQGPICFQRGRYSALWCGRK
jgi:hypothetical protein